MRNTVPFMAGLLVLAATPLLAGPGANVGDKAPTLSAPSWLNLPKGMKKLSSADLKGRVLYVDFWATW